MDTGKAALKLKRIGVVVGAGVVLACGLLASNSFAADKAELRTMIDAGQYQEAIDAAKGDADLQDDLHAILLTVEAINTRILLGQSNNPKRDAKHAMTLAQQVMTADPAISDASIHYAISLGFYGRTVSVLTAFRKKIPIKIKEAIKAAQTANPDNGLVHALEGAWHFSVVAKAGENTARKRYGASILQGTAAFEQALAYAPGDILTMVNYIYMLHATQIKSAGPRKESLIKRALATTPKGAAERSLQDHLRVFTQIAADEKAAMKHAKKFLQW